MSGAPSSFQRRATDDSCRCQKRFARWRSLEFRQGKSSPGDQLSGFEDREREPTHSSGEM
jgi:hypothetical protein